jgi:predicted nucleic acid-binding protein
VPGVSRAPLICDTGALLDYLVAGSTDHEAFRIAIDRARTRYVPGLVLAELDYFLRDEREAMRAFVRDLRSGAFTHAPSDIGQLVRAMEIDRQYGNLRLGLVDASIIALAEQVGVRRIATRDVRDFAAVSFSDGGGFELVVDPAEPDRSKRPKLES